MLPDSGLISKHSWEKRKREREGGRDREIERYGQREREREHVYEGKEQRVKNCNIA